MLVAMATQAWDYNAGLVPAVLGGQVNAELAFQATVERVTSTFDGSQFPGYALAGCCEDGAPQMENTGSCVCVCV